MNITAYSTEKLVKDLFFNMRHHHEMVPEYVSALLVRLYPEWSLEELYDRMESIMTILNNGMLNKK